MKNLRLFSVVATSLALGLTACNSTGNNTSTTDSSSTTNTATTTTTSNNNYAARSDSFRVNSEAGNYLNPRTGKAWKLRMDTTSGKVTDESGHPVRRYVDKRNWWVYDANTGDTVGTARMNKNQLMYRGNTGDWQTYDKRWTDDMDSSSMNSGSTGNDQSGNMSGDTSGTGGTSGTGHSKVKVKTPEGKMKATDKGVKTSTKG